MDRILDYEQISELLDNFKEKGLVEMPPIGKTHFGYDIRYFTYGNGDKDIIITSGTHSGELITVHFVLKLIESVLNKFDKDNYKIHFIPIVNPEGNIIVTSAIRKLLPKSSEESLYELGCANYYMNAVMDARFNDDYELKMDQLFSRICDYSCIDEKHKELRNNVKEIFEKNSIPMGLMLNWSNNGRGVDLNHNTKDNPYIEKIKNNEIVSMKLNGINLIFNNPAPAYYPNFGETFNYEKENEALLNFYKSFNPEKVFASIIYHSTGELVFVNDLNRKVASKYALESGYKEVESDNSNKDTFNKEINDILPSTFLVELSSMRANPLGPFSNIKNNNYSKTIESNLKAFYSLIEDN